METDRVPPEFRRLGGDLALDFANTRSGPPGGAPDVEQFTEYADVLAWAVATDVVDQAEARRLAAAARAHPEAATAAFARASGVRDDIDAIFRGLVAGRAPSRALLSRLRDAEADALQHAELDGASGYGWTWRHDRSLDRPIRPVVHAAVRLLSTAPLDRLKACGGCSYLFLDESKNRSRRWCSMDDCGTTEKMRRYVEARRARAAR